MGRPSYTGLRSKSLLVPYARYMTTGGDPLRTRVLGLCFLDKLVLTLVPVIVVGSGYAVNGAYNEAALTTGLRTPLTGTGVQ